jgi:hypothetical protein
MTFFYNLNKTLDSIREKPETAHGQLNERAMPKQRPQEVDEGFMDAAKSAAQQALNVLGHGDDQDLIRDLQKKAGLPQTGKVPPQQPGQQNTTTAGQQPMAEEGGIPMTPKQKSFAAIAEPKDKITFADKIAGAKKEVDEMLGDVAAEAMKNALSGGQKKLDKNKNGKLDASDFEMLRKGGKQETDEGWDDMMKDVERRRSARKPGEVTHGAKHDTEETPTGRRVTRRTDPNTGYSVGSDKDDEGNAKSSEKRGRGRPKKADKAPERVTAKAYKHKGGRKEKVEEGPDEGIDLVKLAKVIASCKTKEQLAAAQNMANNFLKKHQAGGFSNMKQDMGRRADVTDTLKQKNRELGEKAVSKGQAVAARIARGVQKGEATAKKGSASAEMAKMEPKELKKFAKTDTKGLPKKKEKTEETTTAGSVAPTAGGKSKGGSMIGKGIYDSVNRELESMIAEGMNVSVSMNSDEHGEPRKSITISADGEAAEQLAQLLNLAGMQGQGSEESCGTCGEAACHCDEQMVDENSPDWPTDQETIGNDDPLMRRYAGGVNGPKSTGQTTGAPYNSQPQRQGMMGENKDLGMKLYAELKSFKG